MRTNKSRLFRKMLLATLAAVMMFSSAVMAKTVTMKWNSSNKMYMRRYTAQKSGTVKFKLNITKNGLLDVTGLSKSSLGSLYGVSITLVNGNGTRLDYYSSNYVNANNSDYYARYAVTPGTYYLKVKANEGYQYVLGAKFKVKCANAGGTSKAKALTLPRGKAATGVISAYSFKQARWFKFYVPSQGNPVKLVMQLNGGQGMTTIYTAGPGLKSTRTDTIFAVKGESRTLTLTLSQKVYTSSGSYTTGPKAGWYYVLFTKDSSGSYKRSSGQFAVKWNY